MSNRHCALFQIGRANQQPVKQPSISTGFQAYKDPEENDGK